MDNIDYLYVRIKSDEMLTRLGESEAISLAPGALAAAPAAPVPRNDAWSRLRRFVRLRRRSMRVLSGPAP
jgi:hypothetical protein